MFAVNALRRAVDEVRRYPAERGPREPVEGEEPPPPVALRQQPVREVRYAPIEPLPPIRRQFPEPGFRQEPRPQPVPEHVIWPPPDPQPAPRPPPLRAQDALRWPPAEQPQFSPRRRRPAVDVGRWPPTPDIARWPPTPDREYRRYRRYREYEYPPMDYFEYRAERPDGLEERWVTLNGRQVLLWPPVDPEEGPPGPPEEEWSTIGLVWYFLTRWMWLLIFWYTVVFVRLLVVAPVLRLAGQLPAVVRAFRWVANAPWAEIWHAIRSFRLATVVALVDALRDMVRRAALAIYRVAVRDARYLAAVLVSVGTFLAPVVYWVLWMNFMFFWEARQDVVRPEDPISWSEEFAVNHYFHGDIPYTRPRWRHTVDGGMVRLVDWSSF